MSEYMNNINPEMNMNQSADQTVVDTTATEMNSNASYANNANAQGNPYAGPQGNPCTNANEAQPPRKHRNLKAAACVAVAVCVAAALTITGVATNGFGLVKGTTNTASTSSGSTSGSPSGTNTVKAASASVTDISETSSLDVSDMFTDRNLEQTWDESEAETIDLADGASSTKASGVTIEGDTITITEEGVYVLSGSLSDGQIIVDCADEDAKVQLVLNGVTITNDSSAAIYVKSADKTFITTAKGTTNTLSMTGTSYEAIDENNIDAVIFAKDDITLNGEGTLNVTGATGHGIVCKDDLKVTGGTINITSPDHALNGKDSVRIADGILNLKTTEEDGDGIHSGNDEDSTKGWIYIAGGNITIAAQDDGIHSDTEVRIDGGTIDVSESYEGIEGEIINVVDGAINVVSSDDGFNAAGGSTTEASDGRASQTAAEAGDSTGAVTMMSTDSSAAVATAMDTQSSDTDATSSATVTTDSMDSARGGFGGGRGGMGGGMMDVDENAGLYFYGGTTTVDAGGDGLDSNGVLVVNGGTIYVSGPTNSGNGALDYGTSAVINGGTVIAAGAAGMDETFGSDSTQGVIRVQTSSTVTGEVQLLDADGNVLCSYTPTKQYSSVVISTAGIADGATYTVKTGSESTSVTMDGLIYGESSGMGGFGGGMQGGMGGKGQRPDMNSGSSDSNSSDGSSDSNSGFGGKGGMTPPDMNSNGSSDSSDGSSSGSGFGGRGGMTPPDMNSDSSSSSDGSGRMAPPDMGGSDNPGSSNGTQRGPRGGRPGSNNSSGSSDSNANGNSGSSSSDNSL